MTLKETDIMYENESHWVLRTSTCYEILKTGPTCSTVVGTVSLSFPDGLARAIREADKRHQRNSLNAPK